MLSAFLALLWANFYFFPSLTPGFRMGFSSKWAPGRHLGLCGENTATKLPLIFRTPQNNHQMISPGQQGSFEVTRAASKGGFHVIHDLGGGGGEGDGRLFFNISATFCRIWTIQLAASSLLVTLTTYYQKYHLIFAQMRSKRR